MKASETRFEGEVEGIAVHVVKNSLLHEPADALVLPEFNDRLNRGGIAAQIIAHKDGMKGMQAFESYLRKTDMAMGQAYLTRFEGPVVFGATPLPAKDRDHPAFILHTTTARAVSLGNPAAIRPEEVALYRKEQWDDVQQAVADATVHIRDANIRLPSFAAIRTLNIPLLGSGVTGSLSYQQSSEAILQIVQDSAKMLKRAGIRQINLTVHNPSDRAQVDEMFAAAQNVLCTKSYENAVSGKGEKPFDMKSYLDEHGYSQALMRGAGYLATGNRYTQQGMN